jgi:hypothetical protein
MQKEIKIHATGCYRQPQGTISQFTKAPFGHNLKWHRIYNEFSEEKCQTQR